MTDNKEKSTITVDEKDILDMSDKIRQNMREDAEFAEKVDKILAYNKEKADMLFTTIGFQLPKTTSAICYDNSIAYSVKNVNTKTLNKEKTDELFTTIGYQLSKTTSAICFDNSIAYSVKNVNTKTLTKANIQKLEVNQSKSIIDKLRENEKKIQSMDKAAALPGKKKDDMCK